MREIRRKDRAVSEREAIEIIRKGEYGILSTVSPAGIPCSVPLNYCYSGESLYPAGRNTPVLCCGYLYFHCAPEGEKLDNIRNNQSVSFTVVGKTEVLPSEFGTLYESAVVSGTAQELNGYEKQSALELLIKKYSPDHLESGSEYIRAMYENTAAVSIQINAISGKAKK